MRTESWEAGDVRGNIYVWFRPFCNRLRAGEVLG